MTFLNNKMNNFHGPKITPNIPDAELKLSLVCLRRMRELYCGALPLIHRLEEEFDNISSGSYASKILFTIDHVEKLRAEGHLVGYTGAAGASLISFLSGITDINPMPLHLLCPECRHVIWADAQQYQFPLDLPEKKCLYCRTSMRQDGFNFEPATLFGIDGDKEPNFYLTIGTDAVSSVERNLVAMFSKDKVLSKPDRQTFFIIPEGRTAADYKGIPMKNMDEYLMKFDYIVDDNLTLLEKLRKMTGIYPANDDLIKNLSIIPDEKMVSSIEDVQEYLMFKGLERDKAFRLADWVRRGRRLNNSQKQRMWEHGVEYDYIEALDEIDYLPPRAQQMAELMMKQRLEWYKENYPLEYEVAVNEVEKK